MKNKLLRNVSDAVSSLDAGGFVDGNTSLTIKDYDYDVNGNLTQDLNKGITEITYNHLNLPAKVTFESGDYILYHYTAAGEKVRKLVKAGDTVKEVDYLDGFQYAGKVLQFFPHAEGYVKATVMTLGSNPGYMFDYVYNYTDYLGNIRLSYTKDPKTGQLRILEENHYYPFGLKHEVYTLPTSKGLIKDDDNPGQTQVSIIRETEYMYKYNGKEWQDELGLNFYDYGARNYDPALGRWMNPDPLAEKFMSVSPYTYALNNPVVFVDPDGMETRVNVGYNQTTTKSSSFSKLNTVDLDGLAGGDPTKEGNENNANSAGGPGDPPIDKDGYLAPDFEGSTENPIGIHSDSNSQEERDNNIDCCPNPFNWLLDHVVSPPVEGVQIFGTIIYGATVGVIKTGIEEGTFEHLKIGGDVFRVYKFENGRLVQKDYKPGEMSFRQEMDAFVKPAASVFTLPLSPTGYILGDIIITGSISDYFIDHIDQN